MTKARQQLESVGCERREEIELRAAITDAMVMAGAAAIARWEDRTGGRVLTPTGAFISDLLTEIFSSMHRASLHPVRHRQRP